MFNKQSKKKSKKHPRSKNRKAKNAFGIGSVLVGVGLVAKGVANRRANQ